MNPLRECFQGAGWLPAASEFTPQKPELLLYKKWEDVDLKRNHEEVFRWDGTTLVIHLTYGGGFQHDFKVYIHNTGGDLKHFEIGFEDLDSGDDREALIHSTLRIDLKDYAYFGNEFKVIQFSDEYSRLMGVTAYNAS